MTEPRTEAGRALLRAHAGDYAERRPMIDHILAIEKEATAIAHSGSPWSVSCRCYHEACGKCWSRFQAMHRRAEKAEARLREIEGRSHPACVHCPRGCEIQCHQAFIPL